MGRFSDEILHKKQYPKVEYEGRHWFFSFA